MKTSFCCFYLFAFMSRSTQASSPFRLIKQTSLRKFAFLVPIEIESSWDRSVVPGFDAEQDSPEHDESHDADDDAGDPLHSASLSETMAGVILSIYLQ